MTNIFHLQFSRDISPAVRYNNRIGFNRLSGSPLFGNGRWRHNRINPKGLNDMMDEKDAWNSFVNSGSVLDYLEYKAIEHAGRTDAVKEDKDEVQNQGSDPATTEYR